MKAWVGNDLDATRCRRQLYPHGAELISLEQSWRCPDESRSAGLTVSPPWLRLSQTGRALRIYFALALALVLMTLLRDRFEGLFGPALLVPYVVLVAIAARWGGQGAAIFISLATIPLVDYFLLGPQGRLDLSLRQTIQIALVLLAGLGLGWLLDNLRTARERAEASTLAERAAVGERDTLLSVIAHDLRNPLTAVRARIQLAQMALQRTPAGEAEALGS